MDASNPKWTSVDQFAEKCYSISPYAYCANNPIIFVDPDGKNKTEQGEEQGATLYYDPDATEKPSGEKRDPRIGLAHELGHFEDFMNGTAIPINRNSENEDIKITIYKIELNEQTSVDLENIIRRLLNYENRPEHFKK